jgi:tetratricopeptide (TPR) repeat protein
MSAVFAREPDGQVRFRRPALQEAAYASVPFKLRRRLHEAVGLALEREQQSDHTPDPAVLSHHFALAGDHGRAYRYGMLAASRAAERFAHAEAARLYHRAIEAGRTRDVKIEPHVLAGAWEQMGDCLRSAGEPAAASRALTEALRLLRDDPIAEARLCQRHAEVAERSEALIGAVRWLKRGLRVLDRVEGTEAIAMRAHTRAYLAGIRNRQGRWDEAIDACQQAIAEAESVGELSALAHASYALDWALVESGRQEEATHSWRALEIYEQLGDLEHEHLVLNNLGMFAYFAGRWEDAVELYHRAAQCGERSGRPADVAFTDCNVGEILSDQGHLDAAEASLSRARRIWSSTGERQAVAFVDVLLARLAVRRGQCGAGLPMLEAAEAELRRLHLDAYADFARALVAEAEALAGNALRGLDIARAQLAAADRHRALLQRTVGVALARLGLPAAARAELLGALTTSRERRADYDTAATIDVLDMLGQADADMLRERDSILLQLQIKQLPVPALASVAA